MKAILTATARQAGEFVMRHFGRLREEQVEEKTGKKDLVTFVDRETEKMIFGRLNDEFPDHGLVGEESGRVQEGAGASFVVDPIDGTVNYAHGIPHFGISIARQEAGEITHGLIYLPYFDEMYYAEKGIGASVNGEKLHVSENRDLSRSIVATGFACIRGGLKPDGVPIFGKLIYKVLDLRRLGAATVDLAYVSRGIFEGFYEMGLSPWDTAAGKLLVEEAGGIVTGFSGVDDPIYGGRVLATNGYVHEEVRNLIEEALES